MTIVQRKKFNGKTFFFFFSYKTKVEAKERAKAFKEEGNRLVRMVKTNIGARPYLLYIRAK